MKKSYKLENLGCANCAAKMEVALEKLKGIESATIGFMSQRLTLVGDDVPSVIPEAQKVIGKIEKGCRILV